MTLHLYFVWIVCIYTSICLQTRCQKIFTLIICVGKTQECLHSKTGNVKVLEKELRPKPSVSQKAMDTFWLEGK